MVGEPAALYSPNTRSLAPLAVRLLPLYSMLVRRLSFGLPPPAVAARMLALGRCMSKLLLLLPRRRGGGGGGAPIEVAVGLVTSSAEPERRFEERGGGLGCMEEAVERRDEERLSLLASVVDAGAPDRRVGGGGGGLEEDVVAGGGGEVVGVCSADGAKASSTGEDRVAPELLRERASDDLSWLCRRERGGVGGLRRCGAVESGVFMGGEISAASSASGFSTAGSLDDTGSAGGEVGSSFCFCPETTRGRGGSGLSDGVRCGPSGLVPGAAKEGEKSENDTTCGARVMDFPCLCRGGGGFFFSCFRSPRMRTD